MHLRIGLALLLPVLMLAVLGPILLIDPQYSDLFNLNVPPFADWAHSLGTDVSGRDTLARLAHGLRLTLLTGMLALLVAQAIGGLLGFAILAKQPNFAPIIVKTKSQIMALLWIVTMSIFLFATLTDGTDTLEWTLGLITHLIVFGAAILLLVLRKKGIPLTRSARTDPLDRNGMACHSPFARHSYTHGLHHARNAKARSDI